MAREERVARLLAPVRDDAIVAPEVTRWQAVHVELELGHERGPGPALERAAVPCVASQELVRAEAAEKDPRGRVVRRAEGGGGRGGEGAEAAGGKVEGDRDALLRGVSDEMRNKGEKGDARGP